jgi:MFS family permease
MLPSSNAHMYIAACIACLTASLFGCFVGFIGGVLVLPSFLRSFRLDDLPARELAAAESQIVTLWPVGAFLGVPLGMPICSRLGRKICLLFSAMLYVLGPAVQLAIANGSLAVFEAGRLLNGLGVGAGTLASPI